MKNEKEIMTAVAKWAEDQKREQDDVQGMLSRCEELERKQREAVEAMDSKKYREISGELDLLRAAIIDKRSVQSHGGRAEDLEPVKALWDDAVTDYNDRVSEAEAKYTEALRNLCECAEDLIGVQNDMLGVYGMLRNKCPDVPNDKLYVGAIQMPTSAFSGDPALGPVPARVSITVKDVAYLASVNEEIRKKKYGLMTVIGGGHCDAKQMSGEDRQFNTMGLLFFRK